MVQYLNKDSFRRRLQAGSFLQREEEDVNVFADRDEANSSEEDVKEQFDKLEFIHKFHAELTQLMNQLIGEPTDSQCNK